MDTLKELLELKKLGINTLHHLSLRLFMKSQSETNRTKNTGNEMKIKFEKTNAKKSLILGGITPDLINTCVVHAKEFDTLVIVDDDGNHEIYGAPVKVTHNEVTIEVDPLP